MGRVFKAVPDRGNTQQYTIPPPLNGGETVVRISSWIRRNPTNSHGPLLTALVSDQPFPHPECQALLGYTSKR